MEFTNEFRVSLPIGPAWDLFTDVERLAPCMPGAVLTEVEGDRFHGTVKVRVGAVTVQYRGTATFEEQDEATHTVRLKAAGRDTHGQGNADAHITARLAPDGDGTRVTVETRLSVSGKVAQFGAGVMTDISKKLIGQFVDCLEEHLAAGREQPPEPEQPTRPEQPTAPQPTVAAATVTPAGPAPRQAPVAPATPPEAEPLDLVALARGPLLKRLAPVALGALVLLLLLGGLRRARGCRRPPQ
ncbi:SRPBCC family protein [Kitasatospora sp. MBT63]|uniref:SRPBCC family protein n=1 Tax=Kitasatospora sp. MBT63 TaxID=1444768 RepID=UPI000539FAAC|nr:SRPBCC family protein [Kitasatospora sp. MBT63]